MDVPADCRAFVERHHRSGHETFIVATAVRNPADLTPEIVELYVAEMAKAARLALTKAMNGGPAK